MCQAGGIWGIEKDKSGVQRLDLLGLQPGAFLNSLQKILPCEPIDMSPSCEKKAVEPIIKGAGIRHRGPENSSRLEHAPDLSKSLIQSFKVFQGVVADHQIDTSIRQGDDGGIPDDVKALRIRSSGKGEIYSQNSSQNPGVTKTPLSSPQVKDQVALIQSLQNLFHTGDMIALEPAAMKFRGGYSSTTARLI